MLKLGYNIRKVNIVHSAFADDDRSAEAPTTLSFNRKSFKLRIKSSLVNIYWAPVYLLTPSRTATPPQTIYLLKIFFFTKFTLNAFTLYYLFTNDVKVSAGFYLLSNRICDWYFFFLSSSTSLTFWSLVWEIAITRRNDSRECRIGRTTIHWMSSTGIRFGWKALYRNVEFSRIIAPTLRVQHDADGWAENHASMLGICRVNHLALRIVRLEVMKRRL